MHALLITAFPEFPAMSDMGDDTLIPEAEEGEVVIQAEGAAAVASTAAPSITAPSPAAPSTTAPSTTAPSPLEEQSEVEHSNERRRSATRGTQGLRENKQRKGRNFVHLPTATIRS